MTPKFYYNLKIATFFSEAKEAFMDSYLFPLTIRTIALDQDILIALQDIERIYAPDMEVSYNGSTAVIRFHEKTANICADSNTISVNDSTLYLLHSPRMIHDTLCVPLKGLMVAAFGMYYFCNRDQDCQLADSMIASQLYSAQRKDVVIALSETEIENMDASFLRYTNLIRKGKPYGIQRGTYWMPDVRKTVPYILYVPTKYNPEIPAKLAVFLHGGSLGEVYAEEISQGKIYSASERYQYFLLCVNACTFDSCYGATMSTMKKITKEDIYWRKFGDLSVMQAIETVRSQYNIADDRIFLMGNSMGGDGTCLLACVHPGIFHALAPSSCTPRICNPMVDYSLLKETPIRFIYGTEDVDAGYEGLNETYRQMVEAGCNVELRVIGGGMHVSCWADVFEETLAFFDQTIH